MKTTNPLPYKNWIIALSIAIPVAVALLFRVKLDYTLPVFLPPIYAGINAITALTLIGALWAIKKKQVVWHERLVKTALALSALFLLMYVAYHMTSDSTKYEGEGLLKWVYLGILISHILLSIGVIPFVLITYVRGISRQTAAHRKIAKISFPLWLYVAVSGVIVYWMISPYY
ncbi:MAG: DUF420 domain-containing protein [Lutibacter sp.]|jgi:putative membrane protein|nr:DUF420 domain-containing protein [Lutibacter sp.]